MMEITVWNDYICPWAYLGRARTAALEEMGHSVNPLPYELHPEIVSPVEFRQGGRMEKLFGLISEQCVEANHPFNPPTRTVNSRPALELAEIVRTERREQFPKIDRLLAEAYFVDDRDISDESVLGALVADAGLDPDTYLRKLAIGDGTIAVVKSMELAREHGIAATPAWLFPNGFVIPGVQPVEQMTRWVKRMSERA